MKTCRRVAKRLPALGALPARAAAPEDADRRTVEKITADNEREILVEGRRDQAFAGTKTEPPLIEVPQPLTVITDDVYLAQGAINIAATDR